MEPDQISDDNYDEFEIISDRMTRSYDQLRKDGFPEEETAKWDERLKRLPRTAQKVIRTIIADSSPNENNTIYDMSEARFERIADRMIHAYAKLIRKGFPKEEVAQWESRLSHLTAIEQEVIREAVAIDDRLKEVLADQHHQRRPLSR